VTMEGEQPVDLKLVLHGEHESNYASAPALFPGPTFGEQGCQAPPEAELAYPSLR
jgi:hypothetical protein